jgi:hypothetical protein
MSDLRHPRRLFLIDLSEKYSQKVPHRIEELKQGMLDAVNSVSEETMAAVV